MDQTVPSTLTRNATHDGSAKNSLISGLGGKSDGASLRRFESFSHHHINCCSTVGYKVTSSGFEAKFTPTNRRDRPMDGSKFGRPEVPPMAGSRGILLSPPNFAGGTRVAKFDPEEHSGKL